MIGKYLTRCSTSRIGSPLAMVRPAPPSADPAPPPRAGLRLSCGFEPAAIGVARSPREGAPRAPAARVHFSKACGQRGRKRQPCGGREQRWRLAADLRQPLGRSLVEPRERAEQAPGVGVLGVVEDLVERALLDDLPGVHDEDAVGDLGDHAEVVGDQDHREPCSWFRSWSSSMICAWIVTSSAVVGSSAIRMRGLAGRAPSRSSPAGACRRRTRTDSDRPASRGLGMPTEPRASTALLVRRGLVACPGGPGSASTIWAPDLVDRVERGHRVLEDHRDPVAADAPAAPRWRRSSAPCPGSARSRRSARSAPW